MMWPGRLQHSVGQKREGSSRVLGVPRQGHSSWPKHWIKPQVEVLDLEPKPLACPQGPCGRSPGSWQLVTGEVTRLQPPALRRSLQPPSPQPRPLSSWLDPALLAPGTHLHSEEEEEEAHWEEEEARWDLRPIHPTVPFPPVAVRQVTGEGEG